MKNLSSQGGRGGACVRPARGRAGEWGAGASGAGPADRSRAAGAWGHGGAAAGARGHGGGGAGRSALGAQVGAAGVANLDKALGRREFGDWGRGLEFWWAGPLPGVRPSGTRQRLLCWEPHLAPGKLIFFSYFWPHFFLELSYSN